MVAVVDGFCGDGRLVYSIAGLCMQWPKGMKEVRYGFLEAHDVMARHLI